MLALEKEFMTLEEAAKVIGKKKPSLYIYMRILGIKTHKFKSDPHAYLSQEDVRRIKEFREKPWIAGEDRRDE